MILVGLFFIWIALMFISSDLARIARALEKGDKR